MNYYFVFYYFCLLVGTSIEIRQLSECKTGFKLNRNSNRCEDINECDSDDTNNCYTYQRCLNTIGSYICKNRPRLYPISNLCPAGSRYNVQLKVCIDINECETNPCKTNEECINTIGSFECTHRLDCGIGYELNESDGVCEDIDECQLSKHNCSLERNEVCFNEIGSYYCNCKNGFERNTENGDCDDIDECVNGNNCFYPKNYCVNTVGSYTCNCGHGFAQRGHLCVSVDNCLSNPCPFGSLCIDLGDSYSYSYSCECPKGFQFDLMYTTCIDVNECETDGVYCDVCHNTIGSYECHCKSGYEWSPFFGHCVKAKSCEELKSNCSEEKHEKCVVESGSSVCKCLDGFERSTETNICEDVNECMSNSSSCIYPKTCENTAGSYICKCAPGFIEKGDTCERVDKFASDVVCGHGFQLNRDINDCEDIDECAANTHNCGDDELCVNKINGFNCTAISKETTARKGDANSTIFCEDGYEFSQNSNECEFVNECFGEHSCPESEMCSNLYPGHRCTPVHCSNPYIPHPTKKHACIKKNMNTDRNQPLMIQYSALGLRSNQAIPSEGLHVLSMNATDVECEFSTSTSDSSDFENIWSMKVHRKHHATLLLVSSLKGPQTLKVSIDCKAWGLIAQRSFIYVYISENQ